MKCKAGLVELRLQYVLRLSAKIKILEIEKFEVEWLNLLASNNFEIIIV